MSAGEDLARLVAAAQAEDLAKRPPGNWSRVPDVQVARLLTGALRELLAERDDYRAKLARLADPEPLADPLDGSAEDRLARIAYARKALEGGQ